MKKQSLGATVADLRKEKGMTQLELAEQMGVTDKAVSKWERDLSLPDAASLPRLAEVLGISVDELMQGRAAARGKGGTRELVVLILRGVAMAMGISVAVLSALDRIAVSSALFLLGIGLACLAIAQFDREE